MVGRAPLPLLAGFAGGIHVEHPNLPADVKQGQSIEVSGAITRLEPYPSMTGSSVRILGSKTETPAAIQLQAEDLNSLRWQYCFVELEVRVLRIANTVYGDQTILVLSAFNRNIQLTVRDATGADYARLVDSRVRVPGVLLVNIDAAGQPVSVELAVQSLDDQKVPRAA